MLLLVSLFYHEGLKNHLIIQKNKADISQLLSYFPIYFGLHSRAKSGGFDFLEDRG